MLQGWPESVRSDVKALPWNSWLTIAQLSMGLPGVVGTREQGAGGSETLQRCFRGTWSLHQGNEKCSPRLDELGSDGNTDDATLCNSSSSSWIARLLSEGEGLRALPYGRPILYRLNLPGWLRAPISIRSICIKMRFQQWDGKGWRIREIRVRVCFRLCVSISYKCQR